MTLPEQMFPKAFEPLKHMRFPSWSASRAVLLHRSYAYGASLRQLARRVKLLEFL